MVVCITRCLSTSPGFQLQHKFQKQFFKQTKRANRTKKCLLAWLLYQECVGPEHAVIVYCGTNIIREFFLDTFAWFCSPCNSLRSEQEQGTIYRGHGLLAEIMTGQHNHSNFGRILLNTTQSYSSNHFTEICDVASLLPVRLTCQCVKL